MPAVFTVGFLLLEVCTESGDKRINHGQPVRWNRRVSIGGGTLRHGTCVGERDRSTPDLHHQTTFPGYAALGRHYKDQRCGDTAGRCDYIRFALSGLVADWHEKWFRG